MMTALLTAVVFWCLFYGQISPGILAAVCVSLAAALAFFCRHKHTQFLTIDVLAQASRLNKVNPTLKFWTVLVLMLLSVSARSPVVGIFLTSIMMALVVCAGGLRLHKYIRQLTLPVSFLMMSGLALLFEISSQKTGVLSIPVFNYWLCVSAGAQAQTALIMSRALGAVSCLYLLSLTTPMAHIIGVLRRVHCPSVIIELMYLMYRYIFILISGYHTMRSSAKSRLGYIDYRSSMRTTGMVYSNLLARSYGHARKNFDAMESRCYGTEIRFLENTAKVTVSHTAVAASITIITLGISLLFH